MATSINPKDSTDDNTVALISNSTGNSDHTSNQTSKHRNRRSLLLLLLVFILPILVAKLALENQWLDLGVTNQGKLLDQPLTLSQLGINESEFDKQWLIIYRLPNVCPEICLHSIEAVHNSYVALGKDMPRVSPVLLNKNIFSVQQSKQLAKSQWQILTLTSQMNNLLLEPQVLIADPLGNIILRHQLPEKIEQQAAFGKAIIADMKKLLKYSKVG
jgi:hypothetical protein|tara:strand:- start:724 stop:1371 length:648 start_codon:yes stop_codon:yes gene_type:complete